MGLRVQDLGSRAYLGFRVDDLELAQRRHDGLEWGCGFRAQNFGFRVQGSGSRVQGPGFRVQGPGIVVSGVGLSVPDVGFTGLRVWEIS